MRAVSLGIALLLMGSAPVLAVDAIAAFDEFYGRSAIIVKCHADEEPASVAFLAAGEDLRRAALQEFWAEFDAVNPTHHRKNRLRAEEMLRNLRAAREAAADAEIRAYGCDRLTSSAR